MTPAFKRLLKKALAGETACPTMFASALKLMVGQAVSPAKVGSAAC